MKVWLHKLTKKNKKGRTWRRQTQQRDQGLSQASATKKIKELLIRLPLWDGALTHRAIAPLWLLIGFQSATDHIVTVTDGITKVTDHFAKEMPLENGVGGEPSIYSPSKISVCVVRIILGKDKQLH